MRACSRWYGVLSHAQPERRELRKRLRVVAHARGKEGKGSLIPLVKSIMLWSLVSVFSEESRYQAVWALLGLSCMGTCHHATLYLHADSSSTGAV